MARVKKITKERAVLSIGAKKQRAAEQAPLYKAKQRRSQDEA
jgi:hypothetical protein